MGLGEWLSLDIGLGERLLASLKAGKRGERLLQFSHRLLCGIMSVCGMSDFTGCMQVPVLQHGFLCAQVGHFISQHANLTLIIIKSIQLPLINLHLLMCGSQTERQAHFKLTEKCTNRFWKMVFCSTHSSFSCNISSSVASRVVADLLFVSSSSFWASANLFNHTS